MLENNLRVGIEEDLSFHIYYFRKEIGGVNVEEQKPIIEKMIYLLDNPQQTNKKIVEGDSKEVYYALSTVAFTDHNRAIPLIRDVLNSSNEDNRRAAAKLLCRLETKSAIPLLLNYVEDKDEYIQDMVLKSLYNTSGYMEDDLLESDLFERIERSARSGAGRSKDLVRWFGNRSISKFPPNRLNDCTFEIIANLAERKENDSYATEYLFSVLDDRNKAYIWCNAINALNTTKLTNEQISRLEGIFLTSGKYNHNLANLLSNQSNEILYER